MSLSFHLYASICRRVLLVSLSTLFLAACGGGGGGGAPVSSMPVATSVSNSVVSSSSSSSSSFSAPATTSSLGAVSTIANQNVAFVLPFDDKAVGITQAGTLLNHMPAGKFGPIKIDANGHFIAGSERERFLGVNITANSAFPSHEDAEKIASRLAKFGVNLVRFHHLDNHFEPTIKSLINYSVGNSRTLDTVNLEKLDYFIHQLKLNGIYINLNLLNAREFSAADGLPQVLSSFFWKQSHVLGFVDDSFRNLEKEYASNLLTHKNPYTNLTYVEDPAVAFVEINNENGILQQYYEGAFEWWPKSFRNSLAVKWNTWLVTKYASTAALAGAWGFAADSAGAEKLLNGDFSAGDASWVLEATDAAIATSQVGTFAGRSGLKISVSKVGPQYSSVRLYQGAQVIEKNKNYTLGFWAKSDVPFYIQASLSLNYSPWTILQSKSDLVDSTWKYFEVTIVGAQAEPNARIAFSGFGDQLTSVYLANVSLAPVGSKSLPGQTLEARNIQINTSNDEYIQVRKLDWMDFLRSTESAYWLDMKNYLKTDLKFSGLVTGTAMTNSIPSAQKKMDFADAHAYWQHPDFLGSIWDPVKWKVNNVSMVNSINSTISGLAGQRIKGMPFTVSEYQHSSPNAYSAEGSLLAAAYGALQDWDGFIFFSYDADANGSWSSGYFQDFFSINAHPTKMANMLIAANIFRRGDVAAAKNLVTMNWDPATELLVLANKGAAWNVANGSHLNVPADLPLIKRFALDVSSNPQGLSVAPTVPTNATVISDTNELVWNRNLFDKGVVTVDTAKTKSIIGFINGRSFTLGNVTIAVAPTTFNWATVALTLQQGSFLQPAAGAKLLMVLTGNVENTNMGWTDATHTSVSNNWGKSPTMIEVIPATIDLPFPSANTKAWTLDETGQRKMQLDVTDNNGKARIVLNGATVTLWYEVEASASN